jgi:ArsR family transcriptional regulator
MTLNPEKQAQLKARAKIIKALGHPTRLMMVEELSQGERCVCDLTELAGTEMSTVSRHLAQLKEAGILEDEKRGTQVFYRLRVPCILNFLQCLESVQNPPKAGSCGRAPCSGQNPRP